MRTRAVILALLLSTLTLPAIAQGIFGPAKSVRTGAADLATCTPGNILFRTDTGELRLCTAVNTWASAISAAGGTFTGRLILPLGTESLPSLGWASFGGGPGIYRDTGSRICFVEGSTYACMHNGTGLILGSSSALKFFSVSDLDQAGSVLTTSDVNGQQGGRTKTLTETVATAFLQIDIAASTTVAGYVDYQILANDAADFQSRSGTLHFSAVNKAGTETCSIFRADGQTTVDNTTDGVAVSAGTLTNTFTCTTTPANGILLLANATSSLTQTTLRISYTTVITSGTGYFLTPQ